MILMLLGAFLISWEVIGPILFDDTVVQDDFRQSFFWTWRFWDPTLFQNDFITGIHLRNFDRLPLLLLLYRIGPLFTDNLIYYGKVSALILSLVTVTYGYLLFKQLTSKSILSLSFALALTSVIWSTDYISAFHARSFICLILIMHMFYKSKNANIKAFLVTFLSLFISPIAFLICLTMELISLLMNDPKQVFNFRLFQVQGLIINVISVLGLYKLIPWHNPQEPFPNAHIFTSAEIKALPEFNPGGRHPVFGESFSLENWWSSKHWGTGLANYPSRYLVIVAFIVLVIFILYYCFFQNKPKDIKIHILQCCKIPLAHLFIASLALHLASHFLFPMLYMPSRYIGIPFLTIALALIFLIPNWLFDNFIQNGTSIKILIISMLVPMCITLGIWKFLHTQYHPAYVKMNPQLKAIYDTLSPDALVAAHPELDDINLFSAITKRKIFISKEHSCPSYNEDILQEVRRRNIASLQMTYASSSSELKELMKANYVTHFLASQKFYSPKYLSKGRYMEPYNNVLKELIVKDKFYLRDFLNDNNVNFAVIDYQAL